MLVSDNELDVDGGELVNARIENVTSLPTTTYGVGRQVFYSGKPYWWNGSAWLTIPPVPYRTLYVDIGYPNIYPYFSSVANAQTYARNNFSLGYVTFEIYNTPVDNIESITFNSTDNYYLTLNYNTGTSDAINGSLTIATTYAKPFVISGNGVFEYLNIYGGSTSYTSIVKVAKVTSQANLYATNKLYIDIAESNQINIGTTGGTAAQPKSSLDFRVTGKTCDTMNITSGGTAPNYYYGRFIVDVSYVRVLTYSGIQGGEYNIRCKVIGELIINCGDAVLTRHTRIYIYGARITQRCSIAGHGVASTQYYLYAYFQNCHIVAHSDYDHAIVIDPVLYAKVFIDSSILNCEYSNQYGVKILTSTTINTQLYISQSKIISLSTSIYNAGTVTFTVVSQSSTCRQPIGSYVTVTGTLTQNTAFF